MARRRQRTRRRRGGTITMRQARRIHGGPQALEPRPRKAVPTRDREFASFAESFAETIARDPQRFNVTGDEAQMLVRRAQEFRAALNLANGNGTRTKSTIMEKKAARRTTENLIRAHMNLIRADHSISRGDKINLNITERPRKLKRRQCPKTPPVLRYLYGIDAKGSTPGRHVLEFAELNASGSGKPMHAARLELFVELVPVGAPDDSGGLPRHPCDIDCGGSGRPWYLRSFRKSPIEVEFPVPMSGPMLVVYWGRWADAKGDVGPFSETCIARVEGWNADAARMLPGANSGGAVRVQRVEMKYLIWQAPYVMPPASEPKRRKQVEAQRLPETAPLQLPEAHSAPGGVGAGAGAAATAQRDVRL